jgi:hypothetical protein
MIEIPQVWMDSNLQDGTIHSIKVALGWVSNTESFLKTMER